MTADDPKHPPSPVDPGGASPPVLPEAKNRADEPSDNTGDEAAPERSERKGGMIGEG